MGLRQKIANIKTLYSAEVPKQVTFAITNHCNMACTTCSFPQISKAKRKHVELDEAKYAIDFLVDNGTRMISITGGEPFLHPHLIEICEYITKKGIMISYISTNGILLTEELGRKLSKTNLNIVGLSIDVMDDNGVGLTRKVNLKKVIPKAKRILDKNNIVTYAGILLGRHTSNIKNVIETARNFGFKKIIFSYPQIDMNSSYLAAKDINELKGDIKFWEALVSDILKEKNRQVNVDIFNTRVNLKEFLAFYKNEEYTFECPGGLSQFYIDWNLDLYRCLNSSKKYGNVHELKDLNFECKPCSACTQQAHRDYASFYHAFKTVKAIELAARRLYILEIINLLRSKKNRKSLASLMEGYLGGFV
ncbi:MAG: radical SAM protein [Thermoplasmata archaeon]|nr:radical SAM protein [Thermoplasmata archaeon]